MACIVKKHHLTVLFKEMQFVAFFIFHMGKTRMQVKNDLRCLRQIITDFEEFVRVHLGLGKNCLFVSQDHFSTYIIIIIIYVMG